MKISVVTNAYNQGDYLAAAAESVLSQSGQDSGIEIEYWIVDPGSTDNTATVLKRLDEVYPGRFSILRDKDEGPADGLNRGFSNASGDWFVYLNADDAFLPGAFADATKYMAAHPHAGAIIGNGYIVDDDGRFIRRAISNHFTARRFALGLSFALQQSTFYRADVFRKIGGFNIENKTSWDAELLIDLDRAGYDLVNGQGYWSLFRMQPNSITVSQRLAEESVRTHRRYFREEMGRDRQPGDQILRRVRQIGQRFATPAITFARLQDRFAPSDRIFEEARSPRWAP